MSEPRRTIIWGTGYYGHEGLRCALEHEDIRVVGVHAHAAEKIGKDAGALCGLGDTGVFATDDVAALLALRADCLLYYASTGNRDAEAVADIVPFLEQGTNVISIAHYDVQYPAYGAPESRDPLLAACERGNSSILLTGTEPGFAFGQHLYALLSVAGRVDHVGIVEASNNQQYVGRDSLDMYGFTRPLDFLPPMFTSQVGASWHIATLKGIADYLGVVVDDVRQSWETAALDITFDSAAYGTVTPGQTAGTRWIVEALAGGRPIVTYEKILRLHGDVAPHWPAPGMKQRSGNHRITITGEPTYENVLQRTGGMSFTSIHPVNAAPFVCDAPAGVVLQQDLLPLRPGNIPARRSS
jgi:2,4-diaminopentanoate dehydrogenase